LLGEGIAALSSSTLELVEVVRARNDDPEDRGDDAE
jgi:hypothetical protein